MDTGNDLSIFLVLGQSCEKHFSQNGTILPDLIPPKDQAQSMGEDQSDWVNFVSYT